MAKRKVQTNLKRLAKTCPNSVVEQMVVNAEGTAAYAITDPSERLIATIGTCTNDTKFYPVDAGSKVVGYKYSTADFDDQAQLVVNTAFEVAMSQSPKDLVQIAHWARDELKMRTIPQVLMAIAAQCEETKQFVREYTPKVVKRADELKQVFIADRNMFGHQRSLPNSLKRGLSDSFKKFKEYDYLKWEGQGRPHFADVLKMVDRRKGYPLNRSLDHYLKTGDILNEKEVPLIAARKKLSKLKTFGTRAKKLAKDSSTTWEVLVSQFGGTKEVWEHLIDSNSLGYMALMRNMRNMLQAKVSAKHITKVAKKIVSGAKHSRQLPYRFLMAKIVLDKECSSNKGYDKLSKALGQAAEDVASEGGGLPGVTLTAVDTSGSMQYSTAGQSRMTCVGAAGMLAGMLHTNTAGGSICGIFANHFAPLNGLDRKGPLEIAQVIENKVGEVGHGTNAEDVLIWLLNSKTKVDRVVIISDMQTYGGGGHRGASTRDLWERYKKNINPDAKLHCIDVMGSGQSVARQGDTSVNVVNGYSEKLLDTIARFEGVDPKTGEQNDEQQEFTIEYIRKNF